MLHMRTYLGVQYDVLKTIVHWEGLLNILLQIGLNFFLWRNSLTRT
jgi:hypothetical protein